jgi:hypothetical protein
MPDESPKPPDGLGGPGRRLWDSVAASFVLNAGELEILRQAAATADEIASLEAELRGSSLVVAGYAGQPRPNPLLKIIQITVCCCAGWSTRLRCLMRIKSTACILGRSTLRGPLRGVGSRCRTPSSPS